MKTYVVDFYKEFECMGADCPHTCCKGWDIIIDAETRERYLKEPGLGGIILNSYGTKVKSELKCIKRNCFGRCIFHGSDKLCYFQKSGREELMPEVCHKFPRVPVDYGEYVECCLELSCYKVVMLLLEKKARTTLIDAKTEMTAKWQIGNKDVEFLSFVNTTRQEIMDYVWTDSDIFGKLTEIYRSIYIINTQLALSGVAKASEFKVPIVGVVLEDYDIPRTSSTNDGLFYDVSFVDKVINEILIKSESARKKAFMNKVISRYNARFAKIPISQSNAYFRKKYDELLSDNLEIQQYLKLYYSYIILQNYGVAYEDYYVLGPVLLANFNLMLIILFCVSEMLSGRDVSREHFASIVCNVEKMTRHNMDFEKTLLDRIRKLFG